MSFAEHLERQKQGWSGEVMNESLYEALRVEARRLGNMARGARKEVAVEEKPDGSVVTHMDKIIGKELTALLKAKTGLPVIDEEMEPEQMQAEIARIDPEKATYWTVDPIDGTGNYVQQGENANPHYAVMIGLVENGKPVFGMNYYPELDTQSLAKGDAGDGMMVSTYRGDVVYERFVPNSRESRCEVIRPDEISYGGQMRKGMKGLQKTPMSITERGKKVLGELKVSGLHYDDALGEVPSVEGGRYPASLQILEGKAVLSAAGEYAKIWDSVPYAALLETAGLMTVPADLGRQDINGRAGYAHVAYDAKNAPEKFPAIGAVWEGHPETLKQLGLVSAGRAKAFAQSRENGVAR